MSEGKQATKESILSFCGKVPIEEFDIIDVGTAYIHGFTGLEKAEWLEASRKEDGNVDVRKTEFLMFISCVRDKSGKQLFSYSDLPKIRELPCSITTAVCDICMRLSGMGKAADGEILKNLLKMKDEKKENS